MKANTERPSAEETKPTLLPAGQHPGLGKLVSKPGIYRTKLRADVAKEKPEHADYKGLLQFEGGRKASVLLWCHADGSLGLRLGNDRKEKGGNVMSPPPEKSNLCCRNHTPAARRIKPASLPRRAASATGSFF